LSDSYYREVAHENEEVKVFGLCSPKISDLMNAVSAKSLLEERKSRF